MLRHADIYDLGESAPPHRLQKVPVSPRPRGAANVQSLDGRVANLSGERLDLAFDLETARNVIRRSERQNRHQNLAVGNIARDFAHRSVAAGDDHHFMPPERERILVGVVLGREVAGREARIAEMAK